MTRLPFVFAVYTALVGLWDIKNALANNSQAYLHYSIQNFEKIEARIPAAGQSNISQCIQIIDFHRANYKNLASIQCIAAYMEMARIIEHYYPYLAYSTYVLNCKPKIKLTLQNIFTQ